MAAHLPGIATPENAGEGTRDPGGMQGVVTSLCCLGSLGSIATEDCKGERQRRPLPVRG